MKLKTITIAVALLLLGATAAQAEPTYTGASLQRTCRGEGERGWCYGYVAGATDWINFVKLVCIPETTKGDEHVLVNVITSYLDGHPEMLSKDAIIVMTMALNDAYPCRNSGPRQ
jgi:hypothetical protein